MTYKKPKVEVIVFDNSDVITASICGKPGINCGHQTSGAACKNNGVQKFDNCPNQNHRKVCGKLGVNDVDVGDII